MVAITHDERRRALRFALEACGYEGSAIAENFPIWVPGKETIWADYVAFTRPDQQDMSTSAIVAQVIDDEADLRERWLPAAAALAAPAVLVAEAEQITAWRSATDVPPVDAIASVSIVQRGDMANRLMMLAPEAISRVKAQGYQRGLFPFGLELLTASRRDAQGVLKDEVEKALTRLGAQFDERQDPLTPKLVVGALATLMIRDKSASSPLMNARVGTLIDITQQQFSQYFSWLNSLTMQQFEAYSNLIEDLGSNINFAGLEPSMVSDVYESALVSPKLRRQQGTYYTPPELADNMLNVIPIEHFEPQRRFILDPACGSGTMLLAAVNRLNQLQTERVEARTWHRYLTSHLRGYDSDTLATEITKLCLLMAALPIGNSWDVEVRDTLGLELPESERPSIIISNPPWQFHRGPSDTVERANVFLSWMLDNLTEGGFLACVVPLSWLNRRNSRQSRRFLLERATLLEAWRLPASIFSATRSTIAPAVIIAQKNSGHPTGRVTLVKTIRDASLSSFFSTGIADEAYLVEPGEDGERLTRGPLSRAVESLRGFTTIGNIAEIHNGRPQRPGRPRRTVEEATHYELGSLRSLRPFGPIAPGDLIPVVYPDDYDHANPSDTRVRAHKVVVTAKNFGTKNPWRISVGYDTFGASLREMFHMIIPHADWPPWSKFSEQERFDALMAVLGSGFASCWIDENEPTRNISTTRIHSMPFPAEPALISRLSGAGKEMAAAVNSGKPRQVETCAINLENTVNDVYSLGPDTRRIIALRLADAVGFDGAVRYRSDVGAGVGPAKDEDRPRIPSFGQVLKASEDGLQIWISGITDMTGENVSALPQIPGWLCKEGSDFRVEGDVSNIYRARFRFHLHEWLTEDQLTSPGLG